MKRIISLVLAVSMVLSIGLTAFAAKKYTDLTGKNAKYAAAVEALTELGVIDGFEDNTFGPEKPLTRAQVAKMLVVCLGLKDSVDSLKGRTIFSDVEASYWGAGWINAAAQSKIIVGYPDGTFKPEKEVSYAEAFTMALKALGYGNVVDAEGTWPTSYMLKAVELELTDDMDGTIVAGESATRGNTAILLWNMLRTPMWKIYEESQGNGMTLSNMNGDFMLNVKFPKYNYDEDLYLTDIEVKDKDEVRITVSKRDDRGNWEDAQEGKLMKDTDISRLVLGMKVAALVKDYRDSEKAQFLTLTPSYDFVEGLVTDTDKLREEGKIKIEGTEYKVANNGILVVEENDFVVAEIDGTKIVSLEGFAVTKTLPNEAREATKSYINSIDEDELVIIDGKWASQADIKEGDVVTKLDNVDVNGVYYMVTSERVTGSFEALTFERDSKERGFVEVDGTEYRVLRHRLELEDKAVYVEEDPMDKEKVIPTLTATKDNDYVDRDVEVCKNYLGLVWRLYFGAAEATSKDGNFFVVVSDGVREYSTEDNDSLRIKLANSDNPEGKWFTFKKGIELDEFIRTGIGKGEVYFTDGEDLEGTFVWAKTNDKDQITRLVVVTPELVSGDVIINNDKIKEYNASYEFDSFDEDGYDRSDKYISGEEGMYKVTEDTVVIEAVPVEDEDGDVDSFEFRIAENPEKALTAADGGMVAWDTKAKVNQTGTKKLAAFVFITGEAEESELQVGKVTKVRIGTKGVFATIGKTDYEVDMDKFADDWGLDDDDAPTFAEAWLPESFILFTESNNDKIIVKDFIEPEMLIDAPVVIAKSGTLIKLSGDPAEMDTEIDDNTTRDYRKHDVVHIDAQENKKGYVEFTEGEYKGQGIKTAQFSVGDRVVESVTSRGKVVYIVSIDGCDEKDSLGWDEGGVYIIPDDEDEPTPGPTPTPTPSGYDITSGETYTVLTDVSDEAVADSDEGKIAIINTVKGEIQDWFGGDFTMSRVATEFHPEKSFDIYDDGEALYPTIVGDYYISVDVEGGLITVHVY